MTKFIITTKKFENAFRGVITHKEGNKIIFNQIININRLSEFDAIKDAFAHLKSHFEASRY